MKNLKSLVLIVVLVGLGTIVYAAAAPHADVGGGTHTHSYSLKQNVSPTCTSGGAATYRCSCGASYTNTVGALGHSYSWSAGSSAGCTYSGYNSYSCIRCSKSYTETIAALGHSWGSWSTDYYPTCTSNGRQSRKCSRCGTTGTQSTSAYGHNWQESGIVTHVSCTTDEVTGYECFRCGAGKTEVTRSKLGHNYLMTQGNSEQHWKDCSRCTSTTGYEGHYDNTYDGYCDVCGREWYLPPTAPTITVKDTNGNVLTSTWTNKDMYVYVGGSVLTAGLGGVGYKYQMNGANYSVYSGAVSYTSIQKDTTFYAKSYNTGRAVMESSVVTRVLPKIEREKPTFSISVDSQEYEKAHTATITFADTGGAQLTATDYTVQYTWTSSTATPSSYTNSMSVSVAESNQTTATISKNDGTGIYYLHVKLNKKITDNATNECDTTTLYIPFYMDNTAPVITQKNIETNPVALNSSATYRMNLLVTDHHAGITTSTFTTSDIVVKVNGKVSTANKVLTYKSFSNGVYDYELVLTNITETGPITLEIVADGVPDDATNKSILTTFELTKKSGSNFVGPYADNVIPVLSMAGEVTSVTVPADKNLSGVVDKRYVNEYYTVKIPFRILDIGGQDFVDVFEAKDVSIYTGSALINPTTLTVTLDSSSVVADTETNLSIYQKDYTLTLKGLTLDGFMEFRAPAGAIQDLAGNINVANKSAPYTKHETSDVRVLVDNTKPQPTVKTAVAVKSSKGENSVNAELFVRELDAGMWGDQFTADDIVVKVSNFTINDAVKTLTPNAANNYATALGRDNAINYTYDLTLSNIDRSGRLSIQIDKNKIIDKANNGNEAVTPSINVEIDNEGPLLGPITTNADAYGDVYAESIKINITDCKDISGIARYEWQRSTDGTNFTTIYTDDSTLSHSSLEDPVTDDNTYYYRVVVSDTLGNTSTSVVIAINYRNKMDGKPTLSLSKEQIDKTMININGIIKSKEPIVKIEVNVSEIPKNRYENNVKVNIYEITTSFVWPVTQNGVYNFTATDEKGNTVKGTINVNEFDFSAPEITPTKKDATLLTPAQIIFTSNEPVRIIDPNAHPGITYDTTDFSTKIIATVSPDVDFEEAKIFDFENKGLTEVPVEVAPPLITRFAYLRFANPTTGNLNMNVLEIEALTKNARSAKVLTASGQVESYYGFKNESIDTRIATESDINTAIKLGNVVETYVISEAGELVKLEKTIDSNVSANSNYATGNASGMYQKTSGLFDNYSDRLLNDETIRYNKFRMTIVP